MEGPNKRILSDSCKVTRAHHARRDSINDFCPLNIFEFSNTTCVRQDQRHYSSAYRTVLVIVAYQKVNNHDEAAERDF